MEQKTQLTQSKFKIGDIVLIRILDVLTRMMILDFQIQNDGSAPIFIYHVCFVKKDGTRDKRKNGRFFYEHRLLSLDADKLKK